MSTLARVLLATFCLSAALCALRCARGVVSPAQRAVRIFVTDTRLDRLPFYSAAVKEHQAVGPTVWLATGDPFADRRLRAFGDGAAEVALLSRAGVDAVVLTPEWLSFGLHRLGELVSKGRYYALSPSLLDATGHTIGHPFMVRKSGSAVLAITGLALDSANVLARLNGVRSVAPGLAAGKALALMRQRADLVGAMVEPGGTGLTWGADFTVNVSRAGAFAMSHSLDSGRIGCYDLNGDASRLIAGFVDLDRSGPDSIVGQLLDSVRAAVDSLAARPLRSPRRPWDAIRLSNVLVQGMLAVGLADGFMCDSLFATEFRTPQDVGALIALLRDPGRLAILPVSGEVLGGWAPELVLRPGLARAKLTRGQTYRVATTLDYLRRHPDIAASGFDLSDRQLWTICRDILESGRAE